MSPPIYHNLMKILRESSYLILISGPNEAYLYIFVYKTDSAKQLKFRSVKRNIENNYPATTFKASTNFWLCINHCNVIIYLEHTSRMSNIRMSTSTRPKFLEKTDSYSNIILEFFNHEN